MHLSLQLPVEQPPSGAALDVNQLLAASLAVWSTSSKMP